MGNGTRRTEEPARGAWPLSCLRSAGLRGTTGGAAGRSASWVLHSSDSRCTGREHTAMGWTPASASEVRTTRSRCR
jgi:hypothetical protein